MSFKQLNYIDYLVRIDIFSFQIKLLLKRLEKLNLTKFLQKPLTTLSYR